MSLELFSMQLDSATLRNLVGIISEDRTEEIYWNYTVSMPHKLRMSKLSADLLIPRGEWTSHPMWSKNKQMTAYHVPIRRKMQQSIAQLVSCYHEHSAWSEEMREQIEDAQATFSMCMMILAGHVESEEATTFKLMRQRFTKQAEDMSDMYDTHRGLERSEKVLAAHFSDLVTPDELGQVVFGRRTRSKVHSHVWLVQLIKALVGYDRELMQHFGEEEELVVPMNLTEPEATHSIAWPVVPETAGEGGLPVEDAHPFRSTYARHFTVDDNTPLGSAVLRDGGRVPSPKKSFAGRCSNPAIMLPMSPGGTMIPHQPGGAISSLL